MSLSWPRRAAPPGPTEIIPVHGHIVFPPCTLFGPLSGKRFTYGNQLLLFLIKYDVSMYRDTYDLVEYPDAYELIGTYSTVMYVTQDDSGISYVLDALGVMTEWSQINQPADCHR